MLVPKLYKRKILRASMYTISLIVFLEIFIQVLEYIAGSTISRQPVDIYLKKENILSKVEAKDKFYEVFGIGRLLRDILDHGSQISILRKNRQGSGNDDTNGDTGYVNEIRKQEVIEAIKFVWREGYAKYAFGKDELKPVTKGYSQKWGGLGVTLIDSLDTLYLVGLYDEFKAGKDHIKNIDFSKLSGDKNKRTSVFETVIRIVGGLLSIYEISGEKVFLEKAVTVTDILMSCYDEGNKFPYPYINYNTKKPIETMESTLADMASIQLEMLKLSQLTGNQTYYQKAKRVIDHLQDTDGKVPGAALGLFPVVADVKYGFLAGRITVGGCGDSFYEYLLKLAILDKDNHSQYRKMYKRSIEAIKDNMVYLSKGGPEGLVFVSELEYDGSTANGQMEHLACFLPGILALGSKVLNRTQDLPLAKDLMYTCYSLYKHSPTGLSPETVVFEFDSKIKGYSSVTKKMLKKRAQIPVINQRRFTSNNSDAFNGTFKAKESKYILRPETVESLFYLYRITGDTKYQDWGYEIFSAIQKYTKTPAGYAEYSDVAVSDPEKIEANWRDNMESFFISETLKYLYLLFSSPEILSLDEYVFNTEAHPFKIGLKNP
ncbi:Endoplasmic reticulum mannosyl-oligosaccharide 1,2-alpha-mannosidase [Zancudomyces culisetae]|uniref:alpha-1,2-Mannosidase n=1 Tax=Zancudomyces culisetae TaxID=1213189 RepID=A0A1R1PHN2_ZANCU|nr:Endoplasmic reticulum mannosyl-oligosaccharide 1,2-alpha-mannosidase [Zancudomyces culisetae]|eukprot:OMH80423.1 Endoplasmic reticulum mannosyl-oligosaccharide 1,2-alpha-mannosidase [Zancudomyces culisetae]